MSLPDIVRGTYISLLLGNGATPEVFEPLCGITTRKLTHQTNTTDSAVRDCALPDSVPVRRVNATSEQWDLTGSGLMNRAQVPDLQVAQGVTRNWRFVLGEPADDQVFQGYYQGPAMLTKTDFNGDDSTFAGIDITIASDGAWNFVDT